MRQTTRPDRQAQRNGVSAGRRLAFPEQLALWGPPVTVTPAELARDLAEHLRRNAGAPLG